MQLITVNFKLKGGILMFISGQMWNQIRGPPLVHRNSQTGQVVSRNIAWKKSFFIKSNSVFFSTLLFGFK